MNNIFEKIIKKEIPAKIIYEDDLVMSFLDISPISNGHSLVIPKKFYENIYEMPDDLLAHLFKVVKKISIKLKNALKADGINLLNNNGAASGQEVFHYHVHIIPRYKNDNIHYQLPHQKDLAPFINEIYKKIKEHN